MNDSDSDSEECIFPSSGEEEDDVAATSLVRRFLNLKGPKFNAGVALKIQNPTPETLALLPAAPKYLNLQFYSNAVPDPKEEPNRNLQLGAPGAAKKIAAKTVLKEPDAKTEQSNPNVGVLAGRKFLPHQMPIYRPREERPDVMRFMDIAEGPLGGLVRAKKEKLRVRVWTRREGGVRGVLTGFVEAFDKHWNIALRDVDELFVRKRVMKEIPDGGSGSGSKPKSDERAQPKSVLSRTRSCFNKLRVKEDIIRPSSSPDLVKFCREEMKGPSALSSTRMLPPDINAKKEKNRSSCERKHSLTKFKKPFKDANGFTIVGVTKRLELVERHVGQIFMMGNDVVMVELNTIAKI